MPGGIRLDGRQVRRSRNIDLPSSAPLRLSACALRKNSPGPFYCILDRHEVELATSSDDRGSRDGWFRTGTPYLATFPSLGYAYWEDLKPYDFTVAAPTRAQLLAQLGTRHGSNGSVGQEAEKETAGNDRWIALGPLRLYAAMTVGGVDVDRDLRVLDTQGRAIEGLYAVGANGWSGPRLAGHGHHLAWALASGRRCAQTLRRSGTW